MRRNYKARHSLPREQIARIVRDLRQKFGVPFTPGFNLLDFVKSHAYRIWGFSVEYFDDEGGVPAYVSIKARKLFISNEIAFRASLNEEEARFIIAHEIGHMHLHSDDLHLFSNQSYSASSWASDEEQTEWQADTFGEIFLAPDHIAVQYSSIEELSVSCALPICIAEKIWNQVRWSASKSSVLCRCGHLVFEQIPENGVCPRCIRL
jgi:hypothetical protein